MDVNAKYVLFDIEFLDVRQSWAACLKKHEARRRFWLGAVYCLEDHSANQEAPGVRLRGSWMLCTPFLPVQDGTPKEPSPSREIYVD